MYKGFALRSLRKVKGHSEEEGNDAADRMAGFAQNGGEKNVQDISRMMELLKATG